MRVYVETYGCQMNLADTELVLGQLADRGFTEVAAPDDADVILLNTCAIREHAEQRVAGRLTQLLPFKLRNPSVKLGLLGCMAQHHRAALLERFAFLDLVLGPDEYRRLPAVLAAEGYDDAAVEVRLGREETYADVEPARRAGVRAWITAMRGCDKFCTFCIVPYVRGRERSLPLAALIEQVRAAAARGFREVVFLGQTVNAYHDGEHDFADLLHAAARVDGVERIRFTSPHPTDMSERVIAAMAEEPKVCPQLHLPLQSASNAVLARMERGYTIEDYARLVDRLRAAKPGLELSTDVIVGFPGESAADYEATACWMRETGYDQAFLFAYSRREGTRAARWDDDVPAAEKQQRLRDVIAIQEMVGRERSQAWLGRTVEVLVEGPAKRHPGWLAGKSAHFKTTVFESSRHVAGDLVRVVVESATAHTLIGRPAGAPAAEEALSGA